MGDFRTSDVGQKITFPTIGKNILPKDDDAVLPTGVLNAVTGELVTDQAAVGKTLTNAGQQAGQKIRTVDELRRALDATRGTAKYLAVFLGAPEEVKQEYFAQLELDLDSPKRPYLEERLPRREFFPLKNELLPIIPEDPFPGRAIRLVEDELPLSNSIIEKFPFKNRKYIIIPKPKLSNEIDPFISVPVNKGSNPPKDSDDHTKA